jgi:hypothetical protein
MISLALERTVSKQMAPVRSVRRAEVQLVYLEGEKCRYR